MLRYLHDRPVVFCLCVLNPPAAKTFYLNVYPLEHVEVVVAIGLQILIFCSIWDQTFADLDVQTLILFPQWFNRLKNLINPLIAKLFKWNFHLPEVVSRWRDPQLQVSQNYSELTKWKLTIFICCWLVSRFFLLHVQKLVVLLKNAKTVI